MFVVMTVAALSSASIVDRNIQPGDPSVVYRLERLHENPALSALDEGHTVREVSRKYRARNSGKIMRIGRGAGGARR